MSNHYFEVVVEGHHEFIKGFVTGLLAGKGLQGETFFGGDYDIDKDSPFEMLAHLVGMRHGHTIMIVEAQVLEFWRSWIKRSINNRGRESSMSLVSVRKIKEGHFTFSIHTFSREVGKKLNQILTDLSPCLRIEPPYAPEEKETPEGRGIEAYAPLHDYEMTTQGRILGNCKDLFHCYSTLNRHEVVKLSPIELVHDDSE
ncbi:MAG: hypothetical protein D4R56_02975 [Deltaproteobacteria bacterium]|nr:MAG: hypothetical protein D4R56_02975 [Deltaproteobacteria bacterium]